MYIYIIYIYIYRHQDLCETPIVVNVMTDKGSGQNEI